MSAGERRAFLMALYDAQENTFARSFDDNAMGPDDESAVRETLEKTLADTLPAERAEALHRALPTGFGPLIDDVYRTRALRMNDDTLSDATWFHAKGDNYSCVPPEMRRDVTHAALKALETVQHASVERVEQCGDLADSKEPVEFDVSVRAGLSVEGGRVRLSGVRVSSEGWPKSIRNAAALVRCYRDAFESFAAPFDGPIHGTGYALHWTVSAGPG